MRLSTVCRLLTAVVILAGLSLVATADDVWQAKDLNPVTFHEAPTHPPVALVTDGQAVATIAVMGKPRRTLNVAVDQLVDILQRGTGATLPVVRGELPPPPAIVIGDCDAAAAIGLVGADMPVEGFAIKTAPGYVFIVGNPTIAPSSNPADALAWGVYEFAERFVGARWYFPEPELGLSVPKRASIAVPPVHLSDAPVFRMRVIWPPMANSYNGTGVRMEPLQVFLRSGNSLEIQGRGHVPFWWQDKDFVAQNQDLFELRQDGTRDDRMVCYGNPRTLEVFMQLLEAHYNAPNPPHTGPISKVAAIGDTITISPWDKAVTCRCKDCRALWDPDGGGYGTASRIMATFVRNVALETKKRWPEKKVLFIPYQNYTTAPTDIEMPDNVVAYICGMPGLALYAQDTVRASEEHNLRSWVKLTGNKALNWHYTCWPLTSTRAPYQLPHVVKEFYERTRDQVLGSFLNGEGNHWPRTNISIYCWQKVLWNPDYDVDAACDTFCERMFGPAAKPMREFLQIQIDGWEKVDWPEGNISMTAIYEKSYPEDRVKRMVALMADARELAKDDPLALKRLDYYLTPHDGFFRQAKQLADGLTVAPLVTQKVGEAPVIDGKLNDDVWALTTANIFVRALDQKEKTPRYPTTVKSVNTATGIYFAFRLSEPTPDRLNLVNGGRDNPELWWDDNVEIFLDVTGKNEGDYYQLIINAKGDIFDAHNGDIDWAVKGIKTGIHIDKDFWSMEVYIPYTAFANAETPKSGSNLRWHGNFTRHRVADRGRSATVEPAPGSVREYQRMSTTYATYSNNREDFAEIQFRE